MDDPRHRSSDPPPDDYARGSFTFRRMTRGQVIGLIVASLVVLLLLVWLG